MAAAPAQPGWSLATIYYRTSVKAGADVTFARQVHLGRFSTNVTANISASLNADADLGMAIRSMCSQRLSLADKLPSHS
jgi:hypothetical protein